MYFLKTMTKICIGLSFPLFAFIMEKTLYLKMKLTEVLC